MAMDDLTLHQQLELFGIEEMRRVTTDRTERKRLEAAYEAASEDFQDRDSIWWTHSAFCMTGLPHSRPKSDSAPWHRKNGALHLVVEPGTIIIDDVPKHVGVPYGHKARLIMLYIQTHVDNSGVVELGRSLTGWMKEIGFAVTGGPKGTIRPFRDQVLRLSRARVSIHWTGDSRRSRAIADQTPVDGLKLWSDDPLEDWQEALHLSPDFVRHLKDHSVPLYAGAIRRLRGSSLGLDLYCWLAYRLRSLQRRKFVPWQMVGDQLGADFARTAHLAAKIRAVLPDVLAVYPGADVRPQAHGIDLLPSPPPVPERRKSTQDR